MTTQGDGLASLLLGGTAVESGRGEVQRLLSDPGTDAYLASLLRMSLDSITNLPRQLGHDATQLDQDLSTLALTRYPVLLQSHKATVAINDSFSSLAGSLDQLLDATAQLENVAHQFEKDVRQVRDNRDRIIKIQDRINEVEQLLDTPQVVESCVRSGFWSEAIDVSLRLDELHSALTRTAPSMSRSVSQQQREKLESRGAVVIVNRVRAQIANSLLSLRARVLDQLLSRDLKLPSAVRCITTLRRMNELDESKRLSDDALRIAFLSARWSCLKSELEPVQGHLVACGVRIGDASIQASDEDGEERSRWLKRWIELWREIVGETIGMFSDVFLTPASPSLSPLDLFLSTALASLSKLLDSAIAASTSASALSSLLTQLTYCAHSFARYGLDFRSHLDLDQRFEARIRSFVVDEWSRSVKTLSSALLSLRQKPFVGTLVLPDAISAIARGGIEPLSPWAPQPPGIVSYLPPIASFVNSHANALNALRLIPARSLYQPLLVEQRDVLEQGSNELVELSRYWHNKYGSSDERQVERSILLWLLRAWTLWIVPWCQGALQNVYVELGDERDGSQPLSALTAIKAVQAKLEGLEDETVGDDKTQTNGHGVPEKKLVNGHENGNEGVEAPAAKDEDSSA